MNQSKSASFIEAMANTAAGFIFSFVIQKTLNYFYDVHMSNETAAWFVFWFTVASVARSYIIRRLWNSEFWKRSATTDEMQESDMCLCKSCLNGNSYGK